MQASSNSYFPEKQMQVPSLSSHESHFSLHLKEFQREGKKIKIIGKIL